MKPGFQCKSLRVDTDDGLHYVLVNPFTFVAKDGESITVPAGMSADGASTPSVIWNIVPPFGNYWMSAFLHDHTYRNTDFSRERCDALFLEAMQDDDVAPLKAQMIYRAVRMFGGLAFRKDRQNREDL